MVYDKSFWDSPFYALPNKSMTCFRATHFLPILKFMESGAYPISPEGLPRTSVRGSFWLTFLILTVLDLNHFSGLDRPRYLSPDCPQGLADQLGHRLHIVGLEVARQR